MTHRGAEQRGAAATVRPLDTSEQDDIIRGFQRDAARQAAVFRVAFGVVSMLVAGTLLLMAFRLDHRSAIMMDAPAHPLQKRAAPVVNAALVVLSAVQVVRFRPRADMPRPSLAASPRAWLRGHALLLAALLHGAVCLWFSADDARGGLGWADAVWCAWPPVYQAMASAATAMLIDEARDIEKLSGSRYNFHTA
jgi:hypothetical protein